MSIERSAMHRLSRFGLAACAMLMAGSAAWAQQKQSVSYSIPPGVARFVQEHLVDVEDVPGHQVRVFEIHVDFQSIDLSFAGLKVKEAFIRGTSDYTNGSGTATSYHLFVLEDGNKIAMRDAVVGQAVPNPDGSKALKYSVIETFIGGTGRFRGIRGQLRENAVRVPGAKTVATDVTGEYWFEE